MISAHDAALATYIEEISSGKLDELLQDISQAAEARLLTIRRSRSATDFNIGDTVFFNDFCGTKYLRGQRATVISKARTKLIVKLETPMGRYARVANGKLESVEIRVPASIIDRV